jgi:hypothetical protein
MADYSSFVTVFPEFAGSSSGAVAYWLGVASTTLAPWRLGANYDLAAMLFAAHNIALGMTAVAATANGANPGAPSAPMTSKSAGGLSASYDAGLTAVEGAGAYNATSYGQRLWKMLESAAMGGLYRAPPPRPHVFGYRGGYRGGP